MVISRTDFATPNDNRILYFGRDREQFGFLSHFHPSPIVVDNEKWLTVEHYYQAQKASNPAYKQAIRATAHPGLAKRLAAHPNAPRRISQQSWFRKNGEQPRSDWHEVKLDIMRCADYAKFTQNADLGSLLAATG